MDNSIYYISRGPPMTYHNGVLKNPLLYASSPSKPIPFCVHLAIQNTIPTKPAPCTTTRPILKQTSPRVPLHPVAQSGFGQKSGYQEGSVTRIKRRLHLCTQNRTVPTTFRKTKYTLNIFYKLYIYVFFLIQYWWNPLHFDFIYNYKMEIC